MVGINTKNKKQKCKVNVTSLHNKGLKGERQLIKHKSKHHSTVDKSRKQSIFVVKNWNCSPNTSESYSKHTK